MAGARRHTALPPREPARAAPLPRPAPSLTAASRPRPRGARPRPARPVGSRARTSRFREQLGDESCPPPPPRRPSPRRGAVPLPSSPASSGLRLQRRACTPAWGSGDHRSHLPAPLPPRCRCPRAGLSPLARPGVLCVAAGPRLLPALGGQAWASITPSSLCPINYSRLFEGLESVCPLPLIFSIPG